MRARTARTTRTGSHDSHGLARLARARTTHTAGSHGLARLALARTTRTGSHGSYRCCTRRAWCRRSAASGAAGACSRSTAPCPLGRGAFCCCRCKFADSAVMSSTTTAAHILPAAACTRIKCVVPNGIGLVVRIHRCLLSHGGHHLYRAVQHKSTTDPL